MNIFQASAGVVSYVSGIDAYFTLCILIITIPGEFQKLAVFHIKF